MIANGKTYYDSVLDIPEQTVKDNAIRFADDKKPKPAVWKIVHKIHPAGFPFSLASARTAIFGGDKHGTVKYDHETRWHELLEDNGIWMSDYPIEQGQHDRELKPITSGHVLVGGLGIGYAATALALRPRVRQVVVVEKSKAVINMVAPHLCKHDPVARAKLVFVHQDLFEYLRGLPETRSFRYAFFDIWAGDGESTFFNMVCPLRRLSTLRVLYEPICWNENVMRGQLFNGLHMKMTMMEGIAAGHWKDLASNKGLDLDWLCEFHDETDRDVVFKNWSVPFWRWYRAVGQKLPPEERNQTTMHYAGWYGRRVFQKLWEVHYEDAFVGAPDDVLASPHNIRTTTEAY